MIYGTGELEGAPTLTLPAGNLEVTYYAANWKGNDPQTIHFQILDAEDNVIVNKDTYTSANKNMDGQRGANYEADKFQFSFDCRAQGI